MQNARKWDLPIFPFVLNLRNEEILSHYFWVVHCYITMPPQKLTFDLRILWKYIKVISSTPPIFVQSSNRLLWESMNFTSLETFWMVYCNATSEANFWSEKLCERTLKSLGLVWYKNAWGPRVPIFIIIFWRPLGPLFTWSWGPPSRAMLFSPDQPLPLVLQMCVWMKIGYD